MSFCLMVGRLSAVVELADPEVAQRLAGVFGGCLLGCPWRTSLSSLSTKPNCHDTKIGRNFTFLAFF
jgi:hypothetical protein